MKVNMTPNPLDVVTIHASQGDTEARQWEFELHNNGELIDTSEITEQLFFKAYNGGTEQILPENTSTPTTSPFKGDIRYPQGLLTDQEFTYRQSPTEEDGLARIDKIKGNTLVWNQLVQNGNFADLNNWYARQSTFTVSDNIATVTPSTEGTERGMYNLAFPIKANHKYLLSCEIKPPVDSTARVSFGGAITYGFDVSIQANQWNKCQGIVLNDTDRNIGFYSLIRESLAPSQTIQFRNMMVIDLTAMGLDISSPSDFTSLFNLPYYSYNQGTLLSFNGNGIKAVGANQWHNPHTGETITEEGEVRTSANTDWMADKILIGADKKLYLYLEDVGGYTRGSLNIAMYGANGYLGKINALQSNPQVPQKKVITLNSNTTYVIPYGYMSGGATSITDVQITLANIDINEYVPYTSSTLSLPISTYFPSGMKSAGNVNDELTPTKAITRIGAVDLGSLTYTYDGECFIGRLPMDARELSANTEKLNSITSIYQINNWTAVKFNKTNMTLGTGVNRYICIFNSSYTDPSAFKTAMNGVYLYYELANPTETEFTTASLVTENGEIPLSNEDGTLIGKCTEQLSAEPGFIDAKIKLTDGDGTCYSNKIQLHVERKP